MINKFHLLLVFSVAAPLGGCQTSEKHESSLDRYSIVNAGSVYELSFNLNQGSLSAEQRDAIQEAVQAFKLSESGYLLLNYYSRTGVPESQLKEVEAIIKLHGVPSSALRVSQLNGEREFLALSFQTAKPSVLAACNTYIAAEPFVDNPNPLFGCATSTNLLGQVANKRDLFEPRKDISINTKKRMANYRKWQSGQNPSSITSPYSGLKER